MSDDVILVLLKKKLDEHKGPYVKYARGFLIKGSIDDGVWRKSIKYGLVFKKDKYWYIGDWSD